MFTLILKGKNYVKKPNQLSYEHLTEYYNYDPSTGIFSILKPKYRTVKEGKILGWKRDSCIMTLLLTYDGPSWHEICENGPYYEGKYVIYDYSEATMYSTPDNNGFSWDNVRKDLYFLLKKASKFINFTTVITPNGVTFKEIVEGIIK